MPPELENEMPDLCDVWWEWYQSLSSARRYELSGEGGVYVNPIQWSEIDAWIRLNNIKPTPLDIQLLKVLDSIECRAINSKLR